MLVLLIGLFCGPPVALVTIIDVFWSCALTFGEGDVTIERLLELASCDEVDGANSVANGFKLNSLANGFSLDLDAPGLVSSVEADAVVVAVAAVVAVDAGVAWSDLGVAADVL